MSHPKVKTWRSDVNALHRNESMPWRLYADKPMNVQPDFRELLALFNERKIEYIIVGAYALAYHGAPRFTGDIDIYVGPPQTMPRASSKHSTRSALVRSD